MIYLKENPVGIDEKIQGIQTYLYEALFDWNLEAFGRAEILEKSPVVFYKKNDYKNVLLINEKFKGRFFFIDNENTKSKGNSLVTDVDVVFLLNIKKILPNVKHRADEEVRIKILELLIKKITRTEITITKGIKSLKEFETKMKDRQPYHFLKFSFDLKYKFNNNC